MSELSDNPFAIRPRQRPLVASLKGLLVISALLAAVIVVQSQSRQWLLQRWISGFSDLPADQQIDRLRQVDQLGDLATETLARQLAAADEGVAQTALDLIRARQSEWSARDDDALARAHGQMLDGLAAIIDRLPPERSRWVTQLLNQTIIECVDQRGQAMQQTYAAANELASRLAGEEPGQVTPANAPAESLVRSAPSLVPLPVRLQKLDVAPPPLLPAPTAQAPEQPHQSGPELPKVARPAAEPVQVVAATAPAAANQQAVHRIAPENDPVSAAANSATPTSDSLRRLATREVIQRLSSKLAAARDRAVEELRRRGMSSEEIRVANQLAAPQVAVRLGLLESITKRTDIDPRPWLLWLAEDADRQVRLRAVTSLAAINDTAVTQSLRERLAVETDPAVLAQIHQVVQRR